MSDYKVTGSCLCGDVAFEITGHLNLFQYCHCTRCQKVTGSAFASNMFVEGDQFKWTQGEDNISEFHLPEAKYFGTCFCKTCGSALPWQPKGLDRRIVPAGSLNEDPQLKPSQHNFMQENAPWHRHNDDLPMHDAMPPRKPKA
ncbi:GFA family protein [Reinekea marina]|uniref:GFA family protein n=1 Tax=Reinekea marina TaxID=1310421 RepID=A0ABV7WU29_9GAMM|nr:GFA family protein [Reinekea marina]MDN3649827.1 GFA family protein [Reinekea marina]